jgi:hypothetical protein
MSDGFQPACKVCMNDSYNRSRKKKQKHYNEVKRLRRDRLLIAFDTWLETQKCIACGEDDIDFFDLHHLDPTQKDVNISDVKNTWAWSRLQTELDKCAVLCCKCHRKVHAGKLTLLSFA